jgi:hypothetical protein
VLDAVASEVLNDPIREWFDVLTFARDATTPSTMTKARSQGATGPS